MDIILNHPQQEGLTLEELQKDVDIAKNKYDNFVFVFNIPTVQCLINKIKEQEKQLETYSKLSEIHLKSIHSLQAALDECRSEDDLALMLDRTTYDQG